VASVTFGGYCGSDFDVTALPAEVLRDAYR
jgi:hypothetical protein